MDNNYNISDTLSYKLIYVFGIADELHKNILKIGEATLHTNLNENEILDNCKELNDAAMQRIRNYTNTVGVSVNLMFTTLARTHNNKTFKDKDVHKILMNSGIKKHNFGNETNPEEWFEVNLITVQNAIEAAKEERKSLNRNEVNIEHENIIFRPEQKEAIEKTLKHFKTGERMLWNAKMRFGKTLSALEVIKRMSYDGVFNISKTIILTHRPVVDEGWFEDFTKIFYGTTDYLYGSKRKNESIEDLIKSGNKFIYFASIQDLRGSSRVDGNFEKNDEVFNTDWDLIIIDEAHEGTQTELGKKVQNELLNSNYKKAKQLYLSGTPFNLLSNFEQNEIYTWDYVMEQKAKLEWEKNNPLEPNPYEDLPRLNILTYNLKEFLPAYEEAADKAFNFKEFFRVWTGETEKDRVELEDRSKIGKFIHEEDVKKFITLLTYSNDNSNYPFSNEKFRKNFRHSFWIVPGVREGKALAELLRNDDVFSQFEIVNIAGEGDSNGYEPLENVHRAMGSNPNETYTITISCGKLTTGVTVKPWTAVLYLAGSYSTAASSYLQTIFRVQSPYKIDGKIKSECYVFDFAPDRTLKMVAEAGALSTKAGSTQSKEQMKQFLNFCPVISVSGSEMKPYNVNTMLQELKRAYIERVVDNGFDDAKMYNDNLLKLTEVELKQFEDLKAIIGASKQKTTTNEININDQGFTEEEWEKLEKIEQKPKRERTEEELRLLEEKKAKADQRKTAISILRGISIRIPLLIYGADISEADEITIENFTEIVDDLSWEEFMPHGVTKEMFKDFSKYYDSEIFIGAGRRIRNIAKHADTLLPIERVKTIAEIFGTFRNPDKETVLTPWRTVNMHMGDTLGGWNFFDENYIITVENPRLINNGEVSTNTLFNTNSKILELNSKTGLYPLYITASVFKQKCLNYDSAKLNEEIMRSLWDSTLRENVFVVCKTQMSKSITERTLRGYRKVKTNIINDDNIIELLKDDINHISRIIRNFNIDSNEGDTNMKFNAIVGNPPYQMLDGGAQSSAKPVYNLFVESGKKLEPNYISMIIPSRWFAGGKGLDEFRASMIKDKNIRVLHDYLNASECFPGVEIKGGVSYFLREKDNVGKCRVITHYNDGKTYEMERYLQEGESEIFIRYNEAITILNKIQKKNFESFSEIVSPRKPFGLPTNFRDYRKKYEDGDLKLYANHDIGYIKKDLIEKNNEWIKKWKIFVPEAIGSGDTYTDKINPIISGPNNVCTETYLVIGPFDSKEETYNAAVYTQTKFFHYILGLKKITQHTTSKVYEFIPMQNFKDDSDINWHEKIEQIDEILFNKYNLTDEEKNIIKSSVGIKTEIKK